MKGVYLGLGSNTGDRGKNLYRAREKLKGYPLDIVAVSREYITEPWGFESDNKFYNQVVEIETRLDPYELLDIAKEIENKMGRKKTIKGYSDRIIDIDILFFGKEIVSSKPLVVPHPLLHKRMFVLEPMAEIAPAFVHPVMDKTVKELKEELQSYP